VARGSYGELVVAAGRALVRMKFAGGGVDDADVWVVDEQRPRARRRPCRATRRGAADEAYAVFAPPASHSRFIPATLSDSRGHHLASDKQSLGGVL
jgi:hypothetical protein